MTLQTLPINSFLSLLPFLKRTFTCCMQSLPICLINVQLHTFFFFPEALNCRAPGELFTADLLMAQGVQTMTSIISILKYTHAYIHLHIITAKHMPIPTQWHVCEFTVRRLAHAQED